jgi:SET domain-containing protein
VALEDAEYEPVMLFLNHSCQPSVGFAGNIVLVAMRDVSAGEELVTDYALFDDDDGEMPCRRGTVSCRGTIGGRDWQRPQLQHKYGTTYPAISCAKSPTGPDSALEPTIHWRSACQARGCRSGKSHMPALSPTSIARTLWGGTYEPSRAHCHATGRAST